MVRHLWLAGLVLVVSAGSAKTSPAQNVEVGGTATDSDGKPIAAVLVRIYRNGRRIAQTHTDRNGEYKVTIVNGKPIDTVRYDHTEWHAGLVDELSGTKRQLINKVLYAPKQKLTDLETVQQLIVYERIYWLERLNETGAQVEELRKTYGDRISDIYPSASADVKRKQLEVSTLYELN